MPLGLSSIQDNEPQNPKVFGLTIDIDLTKVVSMLIICNKKAAVRGVFSDPQKYPEIYENLLEVRRNLPRLHRMVQKPVIQNHSRLV